MSRRSVIQRSLLVILFCLTPTYSFAACFTADNTTSDIRFDFAIERSHFSGHFTEFDIKYCWQNNAPENGQITVTINMASARTGNKDLDIGMRDKDALNTQRYPIASWQTTAIVKNEGSYHAEGELTIRAIKQYESGSFDLESKGYGWNLTGSSELKRLDYELGVGEFADTDFIPNLVSIYFDFKLKPVD